MARRIKVGLKGERQIQPVISSLSELHRLKHTKRFTKLGKEEKGKGGDSIYIWVLKNRAFM